MVQTHLRASSDDRARLVEDIKNGNSGDCYAAHMYLKREEYGLSENEAMFAGKFPCTVFISWSQISQSTLLPQLLSVVLPVSESLLKRYVFLLTLRFLSLYPSLFAQLIAALNVIEGGSDTTRATLNVFITAMAADPSFVNRARKDLDSVLGDAGRLPTFEDQEKLPIISACVKEVLRWMPLASTGMLPQESPTLPSTEFIFLPISFTTPSVHNPRHISISPASCIYSHNRHFLSYLQLSDVRRCKSPPPGRSI
jgi:Cytochrome P450